MVQTIAGVDLESNQWNSSTESDRLVEWIEGLGNLNS